MVQTAQIGRKLARKRAHKPLEPEPQSLGVPDAENGALIALLQQWREEDNAMTEEEAEQADRDLAEFKANMNANRAVTGERPVYR